MTSAPAWSARIFAITAVVGAIIFTVWFLVIQGPGSSVFSPSA